MSRLEEGLRANRLLRQKEAAPVKTAASGTVRDDLEAPQSPKSAGDSLAAPVSPRGERDTLETPAKASPPGEDLQGLSQPAVSFSAFPSRDQSAPKEEGEGVLRWLRCSARRYPGLDRQEELF